jgi:hypothetical protein
MAESNGGNRLDDHELRIKRLEDARRELEDSFIVMTHLETKASARIREHAEFIAAHETAMQQFDKLLISHRTAMSEFDDKLNALIDMIGRQQGGLESRS